MISSAQGSLSASKGLHGVVILYYLQRQSQRSIINRDWQTVGSRPSEDFVSWKHSNNYRVRSKREAANGHCVLNRSEFGARHLTVNTFTTVRIRW